MISIEFSVVSGQNLEKLLESIRVQTYQDYEIVVVNSNDECNDTLKQYGAVVIKKNTGKLEARYLAHLKSKGDFEFILEETRILYPCALEKLYATPDIDMAIVRETELGDRFINKLNRLDMFISSMGNTQSPTVLYSLPRYFRREVMDFALSKAYENLPVKLIPKIVSSDMEIIYYEAFQKYQNLHSIDLPLIIKIGETSLLASVRKYYRYGRTQKLLKNTKYEQSLGIRGRVRRVPSIKYLPVVMAIYTIRGLPYLAGYYFSK